MTGRSLTRRHALLFAMSGLAVGGGLHAIPAFGAEVVAWPTQSLRLTRRLSRGLRDGKAIVVTRSWRIEFARQGKGAAVSGEQLSVLVDAPPKLAQLSQLEEQRSTLGLFPILLAPDGTIMAAGTGTTRQTMDAAIATAQEIFAEQGFSATNVAEQGQILAQMQRAGASLLDEMPGDLFYPATEPFRDIRRIALPDGGSGEFEVSWEASIYEDSLLLKTARREVVTRIGTSARRSSEDWSLTPL